MTPENIREKGDGLIEKFSAYTFGHFVEWQNISSRKTENAIQCAIIAVEEIIKELNGYGFISTDSQTEYWNDVLNYLKSKL